MLRDLINYVCGDKVVEDHPVKVHDFTTRRGYHDLAASFDSDTLEATGIFFVDTDYKFAKGEFVNLTIYNEEMTFVLFDVEPLSATAYKVTMLPYEEPEKPFIPLLDACLQA